MGALATKSESLAEQLYSIQNNSGAIPGPQDCYLVLRGIKTLHLRMERHCENAAVVAKFLQQHQSVEIVYWPGFEEHDGYAIAKRQMRCFGGMLSFELKHASQKDTFDYMSRLRLFTIAQSLGGVESLCAHPASMSHASIPKEERERQGIKDQLIRMSVGVEDIDDLIQDLEQAF
jgi:cystathionine beta-lyase/cystathionine gamma-synthase